MPRYFRYEDCVDSFIIRVYNRRTESRFVMRRLESFSDREL